MILLKEIIWTSCLHLVSTYYIKASGVNVTKFDVSS